MSKYGNVTLMVHHHSLLAGMNNSNKHNLRYEYIKMQLEGFHDITVNMTEKELNVPKQFSTLGDLRYIE